MFVCGLVIEKVSRPWVHCYQKLGVIKKSNPADRFGDEPLGFASARWIPRTRMPCGLHNSLLLLHSSFGML